MPQRRSHRKSRYGCDQCRLRRVKCDERPPRCSNCTARDEICHFSRPPPPSQTQVTPQATPSPGDLQQQREPSEHSSLSVLRSSGEIQERVPASWDSDRLLELELMHYWTTRTYGSAGRQWDRLFREFVPKEALRADYLLSAMLALTSFHIASETLDGEPSRARQYVQAGLHYQDWALSRLRVALENINSDNCSPVLFASILVSACVIVSPLLPAGTTDVAQSVAAAISPLPDYLNAVESIKSVSLHWLAQTQIPKFYDENFEEEEVDRPLLTNELRRLNNHMTVVEKRATLEKAIDVLETTSRKESSMASLLVETDSDFVNELRAGQSVALAVYMHWGALLYQTNGIWWAKFCGPRLVQELSTVLHGKGLEWAKITNWCRTQVGLSSLDGTEA